MLGRAASCCDLLRLSPTPGDSSEDDVGCCDTLLAVCIDLFFFVQYVRRFFENISS